MTGSRRASLPPARKRFGQHFLEPAWVTKLVDALEATPTDRFVEIGPGRGALTVPLASRVASVVAVEIDRDLAAHLGATMGPTVRIVSSDFLETDAEVLGATAGQPVRVVGNLPYNVSAPILFRLFALAAFGDVIRDATVMLQKEVADRVVAEPGTGAYGVLSVFAAYHATSTRLLTLPPGAFRPPPKVTSAVVRLRFRPPDVGVGRFDIFTAVVRGSFAQRRKTVANALRPVLGSLGCSPEQVLARAGVSGSRRPGELALADFAALARAVVSFSPEVIDPSGFSGDPSRPIE